MFKTLKEDIQTIFAKDPAAKNTFFVILGFMQYGFIGLPIGFTERKCILLRA